MKCENCSTELVGASIVCRQCNHNNAKSRVGQWRARHSNELQSAAQASATRSISPLPSPGIAPKPEIKRPPVESNSLGSFGSHQQSPSPFESKPRINQTAIPKTSPSQSSAATSAADEDSGVVQFPAWRAQLKDKVREVRERRTTLSPETDDQSDEAQLDPNPIVESALKRIRWSQHIQPAQPPAEPVTERRESKPQELKPEIESQVEAKPFQRIEPKSEPKPLPRTTQNSANPLLARKPVSQPVARPEPVHLPASKPEGRQTTSPAPELRTEARVEIKPAVNPESKPGSGSLVAVPKIRTTGEIKQPATQHQQVPP
ncbi:MAG: hypothetical protein ACRD82_02330, partial [Blastocatellia bacterium]